MPFEGGEPDPLRCQPCTAVLEYEEAQEAQRRREARQAAREAAQRREERERDRRVVPLIEWIRRVLT